MLLCLLAPPRAATAHEISPAVVDIRFTAQDSTFDIVVRQNFEVLLSGIAFAHKDTDDSPQKQTYDRFRALPDGELEAAIRNFLPVFLAQVFIEADGKRLSPVLAGITVETNPNQKQARWTQLRLRAEAASPPRTLKWRYGATYGPNVLRLKELASGAIKTYWLAEGAASETIRLADIAAPGVWDQIVNFLWVGYVHILPLGYDHILFIMGVYFLARRLGQVVTLVTTFTVAHSVTLYLGVKALVVLPALYVESAIALSIAIVGAEILRNTEARAIALKVATVFLFGLFHGLGFAGVLMESGFAGGQILVPLVAFNVGVELGQLTVIGAMFALAVYGLRGREDLLRRLRLGMAGALMLAGVGLFVFRIV